MTTYQKKGMLQYEYPEFVMENIQRLHSDRVAKCMTYQDLSYRTGVGVNSLRSYETLRKWPLPQNYNRLAEFFGWQHWEA